MNAPDLRLLPSFHVLAPAAFEALRQSLPWDTAMLARHHASFGSPYNYSGIRYPAVPFPGWLGELARRVEAVVGHPVTNCLANHYPGGSSTMGFHFDSYEGLAPGSLIAVLSLGAARTLTFRRRDDRQVRHPVLLPPGSLLLMDRPIQDHWQHALLEEPGAGPRLSLTFRQVVAPLEG